MPETAPVPAFVPPLDQALSRLGEDTRRTARPALRVRQLPPPTTPPPGPLDVLAGLLIARAVPFDRPAQDHVRARWGLGPPATPPLNTSQRARAMRRVRQLAADTPVPPQLLHALALVTSPTWHTRDQLAHHLTAAGLAHGPDGPQLLFALADAYRLRPART